MAAPIRVVVTGAAGQIAYSLLHQIASGSVFGPNQKVFLALLDIEPMMEVLGGVVMELEDCAFPLLAGVLPTADPLAAFKDVAAAFLVGAMPRKQGMERKDLLAANVKIFKVQGDALNRTARKDVKVLVVGNPANTNALICSRYAPSIPARNFTAMTRLDQNRATALLASKVGVSAADVCGVVVWGNHSSTQAPDAENALVLREGRERKLTDLVDADFLRGPFVATVQKRGAAVIAARKMSSALSAATAAADHMRDWWAGTGGRRVSMSVLSDGSYGAPKDVIFSFPVTVENGDWKIVQGLPQSDFLKGLLKASGEELLEERAEALDVTKD